MSAESSFNPTGNVSIGMNVEFLITGDDAQMGQDTTCEVVFTDESQNLSLPMGSFDVDAAGNISGTFAVPDPGSNYYGPSHNMGVFATNGINSFLLGGLHVNGPSPPSTSLSLGIGLGL